jgi:hypothetical protein
MTTSIPVTSASVRGFFLFLIVQDDPNLPAKPDLDPPLLPLSTSFYALSSEAFFFLFLVLSVVDLS